MPEKSPTPIDVDFFSVSFVDDENGLAVGAECQMPPDPHSKGQALADYLAVCVRAPAVYRFSSAPGRLPTWERQEIGDDTPGFVGAVAWIGKGRALAVGGTGVYPRREPRCVIRSAGCPDPAGTARAWLYDASDSARPWREITAELPAGDGHGNPMGGLTALVFSQRTEDCDSVGVKARSECGYAGGFRQLWRWRDGAFVNAVTDQSADLQNASAFRYRVRDLRAFPKSPPELSPDPAGTRKIIAVTDGCCGASDDAKVPAQLEYVDGGWRVSAIGSSSSASRASSNNDSLYSVVLSQRWDYFQNWEPRHQMGFLVWTLRTPGGPPRSSESYAMSSDYGQYHGGTARLVAMDGPASNGGVPPPWAVGLLRRTQQAVVLSTRPLSHPCPDDPTETCTTPENTLFALDSFALNAFRMIGDTGVGWAVGDRGAIWRLGGGGRVGADAELPPTLGEREPGRLPDPAPFAPFRPPLTSEPGLVPALAARPLEQLPGGARFVAAGSPHTDWRPGYPEYVRRIVMSRDGSEGWAFTDQRIHRYEGGQWMRCNPDGPFAIDAPCQGLTDPQTGKPIDLKTLKAVARVPYENDSDPANDDEFELIGFAGATVFRFRDGAWGDDEDATVSLRAAKLPGEVVDAVLVAPDDGWLVFTDAGPTQLVRLDAEGFALCNRVNGQAGRCEDPSRRVKTTEAQNLDDPGLHQKRGLMLASAGRRVYLFGTRSVEAAAAAGGAQRYLYPMILYRDPGGSWTDGGDDPATPAYDPKGGYDPGCLANDGRKCTAASSDPNDKGRLWTVAVARSADGESYDGWASGHFGGIDKSSKGVLLRLKDGRWTRWGKVDASDDYLRDVVDSRFAPDVRRHLTLPGGASFLAQVASEEAPPIWFSPASGRWEVLPAPMFIPLGQTAGGGQGELGAFAADPQGGFWAAASERGADHRSGLDFYRHTDRAPTPVLSDAPHPVRERITATAVGGDGSFWVATESNVVYRYDRIMGWDRVEIPGWDPRRSTVTHGVRALAVGPDGRGVAVGAGGRLANIEPAGAVLDRAVGTLCAAAAAVGPCGTGRDLEAAAIASDGAALVAGEAATVLWRPAGGAFHRVQGPPISGAATISSISYLTPERAYLATDSGQIFRGDLDGGAFVWREEVDRSLVVDSGGKDVMGLRAIAVAADGHGYAVGGDARRRNVEGYHHEEGIALERTPNGRWRKLAVGSLFSLHSLALSPDGRQALAGGLNGSVLSLQGERFDVVRPSDPYDPVIGGFTGIGAVLGVAIVPGSRAGDVEAWAVPQAPPSGVYNRTPEPQAVLHYASDADGAPDPLLDPARRAKPLPDAPAPRPGELAFGAFGKQDCGPMSIVDSSRSCREMYGANLRSDRVGRAIDHALIEHAERGHIAFAVFTGDASDAAGGAGLRSPSVSVSSPLDRDLKHRRWLELVAAPLQAGGVPLFAAIGGRDLGAVEQCVVTCVGTTGSGQTFQQRQTPLGAPSAGGSNNQWRNTMAGLPGSGSPAPWEASGGNVSAGSLRFVRLKGGPGSVGLDDAPGQAVATPDHASVPVSDGPGGHISAGGAATHYAVDVHDSSKPEEHPPVARLVFADNSLKSLQASDPIQNPVEAGGQQRWLQEVLCFEGSAEDASVEAPGVTVPGVKAPVEGGPGEQTSGVRAGGGRALDCTRRHGQQAIVVANTPTYSYGPGGLDETATDATTFESTLMRYRASVVVSGRLGWMGRYWATAPGVHEPCPGADYVPDNQVPTSGARACGQSAEGTPIDPAQATGAAGSLSQALGSLGAPPPPGDPTGQTGALPGGDGGSLLPFVVSASAGGDFNTHAEQQGATPASGGFWRGYSIVRLSADGDPRKTIVEQRPVFDWISIRGIEHTLRPGQKMTLRGEGREPFGVNAPIRYVQIDSPAITHRYDLVMADPEKPYLPPEDANGDYIPVPARISTVDQQTGAVRAGKGGPERTYTIALLSVGDKVATYPIAFEPRRSFVPQRARVTLPPLPRAARAPAAQQPIRLTDATPPPPAQPPATPGTPLSSQSLQPPQPPELPSLPTINAAGAPPAPSLNAPPPPPPPPPAPTVPVQQQPQPLGLGAKVQAVAIVPSVNPPAPPPVNPAPPGGAAARKEAKQRQAATAKSEEGSSDGAGESAGIDVGQDSGRTSPDGQAAVRREVDRPAPATRRAQDRPASSFTPIAHRDHASAWARTGVYGGGLGLAALVAALGFSVLRPRPRRRTPDAPAPAWARVQRGR